MYSRRSQLNPLPFLDCYISATNGSSTPQRLTSTSRVGPSPSRNIRSPSSTLIVVPSSSASVCPATASAASTSCTHSFHSLHRYLASVYPAILHQIIHTIALPLSETGPQPDASEICRLRPVKCVDCLIAGVQLREYVTTGIAQTDGARQPSNPHPCPRRRRLSAQYFQPRSAADEPAWTAAAPAAVPALHQLPF